MAPIIVGRDGSERIADTAATYTAKYRDGAGIVVEVSTGCRDADAARSVLADLERRAELVKAGVMTVAENAVADHQSTPLVDHFAAYLDHLTAKGVHRTRLANARGRLNRIAAECSLLKLVHLTAAAVERWSVSAGAAGMSAATRNEHLHRPQAARRGRRSRRAAGNAARPHARRTARAMGDGHVRESIGVH